MRISPLNAHVASRRSRCFRACFWIAALGIGCTSTTAAPPSAPPTTRPYVPAQPPPSNDISKPDLARGGRLFDAWDKVLVTGFIADNPHTTDTDGRGGPYGDGTLLNADRRPMPNTGHDYRFAKLFGYDLRGADGAFAHCGTGTPYVLVPSFLANTDDAARWRARFAAGEDGIPAFGNVLDARDLVDVVAFMLAIRDGELPRPDAFFRPVAGEPCRVERIPGGDAQSGQALHNTLCASCHGADGLSLPLTAGRLSLGQFARGRIYEAWYVILSGKAGTLMQGLIDTVARSELERALQDLFAAYADVTSFPAHAGP